MHEQFLANDLALAAPPRFFAQFGMGIARSYYNSHNNTREDPDIGKSDFKGQRGQRRFAYANTECRRLAENFPMKVECNDVCVGEKNGSNNHVELQFGGYVLTQHHVAQFGDLPQAAKYIVDCNGLNVKLAQMELFQDRSAQEPAPQLHVMALHTESGEHGADLENIQFTFVREGKRVTYFDIAELVDLQARLEDMSNSELDEFKVHHEQERKKRQA